MDYAQATPNSTPKSILMIAWSWCILMGFGNHFDVVWYTCARRKDGSAAQGETEHGARSTEYGAQRESSEPRF